jgi:Fic family protein
MAYNKEIPYNDLPPLPPKEEIENIDILRKAADARAALGELKGRCVVIPNPLILFNTLVLQEAQASSAIENIITTTDKLYQAFAVSNKSLVDPQTKEVLRYREATNEGFNRIQDGEKLTTLLFINIVQKIKDIPEGIRNYDKSTRRTVIQNTRTAETIYTPPEGLKIIQSKLDNLSSFLNNKSDGTDPLIKMAVSHYQFEAIHPFSDGNGRTGRIMNGLFLVDRKLLDLPVLYLSKYIIDNKNEYYRLLRNVTENKDWRPWILFNLEAVLITSGLTLKKIMEIEQLLSKTIQTVRTKFPKIYTKELVEQLFFHPYCKNSFLIENKIAARNAAGRYLNQLADEGILEKRVVGNENLYLNKELFQILSN